MAHYRVKHARHSDTIESIVLDVATPAEACFRAAEWLERRFPGILATDGRNDPTDGRF